jgi:hypothetical protein
MADVVLRIDHLEETVKEHKSRLDELDCRSDTHSDAIQSIDQWRKGNGAKGAEDRLQCVESKVYDFAVERLPERVSLAEADILALQKIADGKIEDAVSSSVKKTMDARDRTAIAYIKAFAPWVVAIGGFLAALLAK